LRSIWKVAESILLSELDSCRTECEVNGRDTLNEDSFNHRRSTDLRMIVTIGSVRYLHQTDHITSIAPIELVIRHIHRYFVKCCESPLTHGYITYLRYINRLIEMIPPL
jgi:hypothetical protein